MAAYNTLIISPHCDDEVLGCGGILNNRDNAFVYYIGVDDFHVVSKQDRLKETHAVSKSLGFEYSVGSNHVNNYSKNNLINEITDLINEIKPKEIYIPFGGSYNQDHQEVNDSCIIALRPHDINHFVPRVFVYEVEQYLLWGCNNFMPNYFEKIDILIKQDAYELYKSQVRSMRPLDLLKNYSSIRGLSCGVDYAEAFEIIRFVKLIGE